MNVRVAIAAVALSSPLAQAPLVSATPAATSVIVTNATSETIRSTLSTDPVLVGGTYLVPAREMLRLLGFAVHARGKVMTATAPVAFTAQAKHVIVMRVGETQATVDGSAEVVSPAPQLIDGTFFVPLRFVAASTGSALRYDRTQQTMYLTMVSRQAPPSSFLSPSPPAFATDAPSPLPTPVVTPLPTPTPIDLPTASIVLRLVREEPARETTVDRSRPEISASFGEPVASASVRILLDGREITSDATITNRYFIYEPMTDLTPGTHVVVVAGRTPLHEAFADRWSFDSADAKGHNYLSGVEPPSGISVTSPLVISGITRPHARIGMVATSSETAAHFSELSGGSFTDHTSADAHGNFEIRLDLVDTGSGFLDVRLDSTAPDGAVAVKTLRLRL